LIKSIQKKTTVVTEITIKYTYETGKTDNSTQQSSYLGKRGEEKTQILTATQKKQIKTINNHWIFRFSFYNWGLWSINISSSW